MEQDVEAATLIARPEFAPARAVLLVDDDELVLAHMAELVQAAGFDVHTAGDGATALAYLEQQFTPIVITDRNMPAMDGLELCRAIRQQSWPGYIYILLLTVHDGESDILAGLEAGADDYLSKRASPAQLVARLHTAQRILGLEQALKVELEEKRRQSLTDPLTGTNNRRYFERQLHKDFKRAQRGGGPLSLLMLDIDHFKRINDQYGHAAGDAVLQELVLRIRQSLTRETDWCARIGGEEFVIVLADTPLTGAAQVAERLRQAIAGVPVVTNAGTIAVTASIGVVDFQPTSGRESVSVESLVRDLDANMYLSKQNGRNRVTLPQPSITGERGHAAPAVAQPKLPARRALRTILYTDDEPDIRLIVQTALTLAEGLTVHTADSGERALELAHQLQPDLLMLDVMMPGLDGPATLKRLRADPAIAQIPVIFVTAKSTPEDVVRFRALGALAVIPKPFDPIQLPTQVLALWQTGAPQPQRVSSAVADHARLRDHVAQLSGKFLERTAAQALTLRRLFDSLQGGDATYVTAMHDIAHKIHGGGAMFGFPAVSECAGEIERLVGTLLTADPAAAPPADPGAQSRMREQLQVSIRQLADAVTSAATSHASR
jgi:two-component system cell cycle response regulator